MSEPASSASAQAMDRLLDLMARLRAPNGCPWDREQTPATLKPQLLEECYEVLEAIDSGSSEHLAEELGDLLLHVVFQAQIAHEAGDFTFADVANGIVDKMVSRHPHVFGEAKAADAGSVVTLWHQLKKAEKPERESALDGVPKALPALMRAEALQKKARNVGFDWPDAQGSLAKVREGLPVFIIRRGPKTERLLVISQSGIKIFGCEIFPALGKCLLRVKHHLVFSARASSFVKNDFKVGWFSPLFRRINLEPVIT